MPCTEWDDVVGQNCVECNGPATHIYGTVYLCCDCHGGYLVTKDTAQRIHDAFRNKGLEGMYAQLEIEYGV